MNTYSHNIPYLIVRSDANKNMGAGHIMRCIALGQAWQRKGGNVLFISCFENENIEKLILKNNFELLTIVKPYPHPDDPSFLQSIIAEKAADRKPWVVLDGYHFDSDYHNQIKKAGGNLLVIDDNAHLETYTADILLNPNSSAPEMDYNTDRTTNFLFGEQYFLLREDFLKWKGYKKKYPQTAYHILITLGGSDPGNGITKVIRAVQSLKSNTIFSTIIAGPLNSNTAELKKTLAESSTPHELVEHSADMPALIHKADLAVSAAGGTCYELAFMGTPALVMITAENQKANGEVISRAGAAINLGSSAAISVENLAVSIKKLIDAPSTREKMGDNGRHFIDGRGADRVVTEMVPTHFLLRNAEINDCRQIFEWANDASTRRLSFQSDPIPWDHHQEWFTSILKDQNCRYYVAATESGNLLGQARFRKNGKSATISVSVDLAYRNAGIGNRIIRDACLKFLSEETFKRIEAYIKPENQASLKAFKKAGFIKTEKTNISNIPAVKMVLKDK